MTVEIIKEVLEGIIKKREIFHSEGDLQFELAHKLKLRSDITKVRIERPYRINEKRFFCDIVFEEKDSKIGIELKYLTKKAIEEIEEDLFELQHNSINASPAHFLTDMHKLVQLIQNKNLESGYVVLLTNDLNFCKSPLERRYKNISLHEGRKIEGEFEFLYNIKQETFVRYSFPNTYVIKWDHMVSLSDGIPLKLLIIKV